MENESREKKEKRSYWCNFYDDIGILFFFSGAIMFILYTVWGLVELGTVPVSPLINQVQTSEASTGEAAGGAAAVQAGYWESWEDGVQGQFPPCGVNVIALGMDEILQATVDTYCGLDPGHYETKINPAVKDIYDARNGDYPDGKTAILLLPKLGVAFTTDHQNGKPVFGAITMTDGKSVASAEAGHPLNPETCAKCHYGFDGACSSKGFTCGNRDM